jgi:hypothetical protein
MFLGQVLFEHPLTESRFVPGDIITLTPRYWSRISVDNIKKFFSLDVNLPGGLVIDRQELHSST